MADDVTKLGLVVGVAALVNVSHNVRTGKDPVPALVGSGILYGGLAVVGELSGKWQLAVAFAWVFLLASLISRGIPLLQSVDNLASAKPAAATDKSSASSGSKGKSSSGGGGGGGGGGGF